MRITNLNCKKSQKMRYQLDSRTFAMVGIEPSRGRPCHSVDVTVFKGPKPSPQEKQMSRGLKRLIYVRMCIVTQGFH